MYDTHTNVISVDLKLEHVAGASAAVSILVVVRDADTLDRAPHAPHLGIHSVHLPTCRRCGCKQFGFVLSHVKEKHIAEELMEATHIKR